MSLKRGSSCLVYEEPTSLFHTNKKARFVYLKKPNVKYVLKLCGKRLQPSVDECSELFKRARLEESAISLVVNEVDISKKRYKPIIFVRADLQMAYSQSVDPRHFFALDIQRVFRGWSTRRSLKDGVLANSFI
jgi:hypothetical protein